jgi:hypothetical protein
VAAFSAGRLAVEEPLVKRAVRGLPAQLRTGGLGRWLLGGLLLRVVGVAAFAGAVLTAAFAAVFFAGAFLAGAAAAVSVAVS